MQSTEECVERGGSTVNGYARAFRNGKFFLAHRLAWIDAHGDIPQGLRVLHKCDNRRCVNIDHLFLGTSADNTHDMIRKRRDGFKLSAWQSKHLRRLRAFGIKHKRLAALFDCSISNVGKTKGRMVWKLSL